MKRTWVSMLRGFSLVELMVSIAIFAFLTALIVAKYGNFNQGVLFNNLAYDMALVVRTAQTYGVSVQGQSASFNYSYGVAFCKVSTGCGSGLIPDNKSVILFADANMNGVYDAGDIMVKTYTIARGATITCVSTNPSGCGGSSLTRTDVTFTRPNPDALICVNGTACSFNDARAPASFIKVIITNAGGSDTRSINITKVGQVSVESL